MPSTGAEAWSGKSSAASGVRPLCRGDRQTQADLVPGRKDLMVTSVHEVWPGHFLNLRHSNRAESIFGKLFVGHVPRVGRILPKR